MTQWIIEKSDGFTDVGLYRISESVRAYAYLILSSQASARSSIIANTASAFTAQPAFLNKVDNSVGQTSMLPGDMHELKNQVGNVGYNNKILVSDGKFNLGKKDFVT